MVWSICTRSCRTLTAWFFPEDNKSFTIFEMNRERLEALIEESSSEQLTNLYLELFNSPDHSLEEKAKVLKIFEVSRNHLLTLKNLLHLDKNAFAIFVALSSSQSLIELFTEITREKDLESYVKIFELLMSFSSQNNRTTDSKKICWKVVHHLPQAILKSFPTIVYDKTDPRALGYFISAGDHPYLSKIILEKYVLDSSTPKVKEFFHGISEGWDDTSDILPPVFTLLFTDKTFTQWIRNAFYNHFFAFSTEVQATAIMRVTGSTRLLLIKKCTENLVVLAKILEEIISVGGNFGERIQLCCEILDSIEEGGLQVIVKELSQRSSIALPYILASLNPDELDSFDDVTVHKKTSFHQFNPVEIEHFIQRFRSSEERMGKVLEFTSTFEVHQESFSVDIDLTIEEVGEHTANLPLKDLNVSATEELHITTFVKEIPSAFLFFAGFLNEEVQKAYMRFLPYLNISQIKEFACGLKFADMKKGLARLQKYSQRLTIEKTLALLKYLPPTILNAWFKNYDEHLRKAVSSLQEESSQLTLRLEGFQDPNYDRESRQYKIAYESLENDYQAVLNRIRQFSGAVFQAIQRFQDYCDAELPPNKRPPHLASIVISLSQINGIYRTLSNPRVPILAFLQSNRPIVKRRREEPVKEDLIFGVGLLKGITSAVAREMGITIEGLNKVGIYNQSDLFCLGMNEKNSHRHEAILRDYLRQKNLVKSWSELADKKIWSISTLSGLVKTNNELFSLSKIVKRLKKEGPHG